MGNFVFQNRAKFPTLFLGAKKLWCDTLPCPRQTFWEGSCEISHAFFKGACEINPMRNLPRRNLPHAKFPPPPPAPLGLTSCVLQHNPHPLVVQQNSCEEHPRQDRRQQTDQRRHAVPIQQPTEEQTYSCIPLDPILVGILVCSCYRKPVLKSTMQPTPSSLTKGHLGSTLCQKKLIQRVKFQAA